ncbi:hypothetical protein scyTo_0013347 [Scyliorhinus torazame]|uniref:ZZ-type domain-containing protein n=1 Tax=Scyliorhinus torazame TaxID=75743 RepID=A0A401NUB0_SCYTO|nr:hypothetical protein [Scyliorhinus torazame]
MEVGMRIVRGVDWKWGNQDDGEGHVGTVVEIGRQGSTTTPDKTVVVQWDCGTRTNYRTGYQGAYDLLLYDNAQIGVRHPNIICDCCKKHGIMGMRWKCQVCFDYDLCTQCYMINKHDLTHSFERYETAHSQALADEVLRLVEVLEGNDVYGTITQIMEMEGKKKHILFIYLYQ